MNAGEKLVRNIAMDGRAWKRHLAKAAIYRLLEGKHPGAIDPQAMDALIGFLFPDPYLKKAEFRLDEDVVTIYLHGWTIELAVFSLWDVRIAVLRAGMGLEFGLIEAEA